MLLPSRSVYSSSNQLVQQLVLEDTSKALTEHAVKQPIRI